MKKNQVNTILVKQAKRRAKIRYFILAIVLVSLLAFAAFYAYFTHDQFYYVTYSEKSNIDYNVYLKENDFYDDSYLGPNKDYIASLIEYIKADFNYNLKLDEKDVEYKYSYRIEAEVNVKNKGSKNTIFNKKETLVEQTERESQVSSVDVTETLMIDYNYYNELIKKFIELYDLEDIDSVLTINMYVNAIGSCETFDENKTKESVMSLSIPLTTKTMAIDISDDLIDTDNNVMQCKAPYSNMGLYLITGIVLSIGSIVLVVLTIRFEIKTRSAENIYERELKKILNNYSSYIQTINNEFSFKNYTMMKVDSFTDMLEIRDTIRQPILMKENADKTGAYFIIPSNTKILYIYRLKVSDIKKEMSKVNNNVKVID